MASLLELQDTFASLVARLIEVAHTMGYQITLGEAWRPPETAKLYAQQGKGIRDSLHISRLAIDVNLFKDGQYLTQSEDYAELGAFWKSLHPLARWGGDFSRPDGNHFSMENEGIQ